MVFPRGGSLDLFAYWVSCMYEPCDKKTNNVISEQVVQPEKMARGWKFWI